jgi:hypothetical protein
MPTFEQTVYVDVDFADLDEDEIVEHLEYKGYTVSKNVKDSDIDSIEQYWNRGNRKEALVLLEREFPELIGISKLLD